MPKGKPDAENQVTDSKKEKNSEKKKKSNVQIDPKQESTFTGNDFAHLCDNEHGRYIPNSKKIGHAVIVKQGNESIAMQYQLPSVEKDNIPQVRPLINIEAIEPYRGMHRYQAETPEGHTAMYAKRFIFGEVGNGKEEKPIEIACFSPFEKNKTHFWGSIRPTPLFKENLSKSVKKDLAAELKETKQITKGGDVLTVEQASVLERDLIATRTPDQNTVMGQSARDAYEDFFDTMADELHPEMKQRLKRAFTADINSHLTKNSYRPEWLHAKGWSLMPMDMNPQTEDNLGAGPKWANTQMMILERVIKWFALHAPQSLLTIKPKFEMLLDSELIKHIDFEVKVKIKEAYVKLIQSIDPFQAYPLFPKASDMAQGTAITHQLLYGNQPISSQVVKDLRKTRQTKAATDVKKENTLPLVDTVSNPLKKLTSPAEAPQVVPEKEKPKSNPIKTKRKAAEMLPEASPQPITVSTPMLTTSTDDNVKAKRSLVKPKFTTVQKNERSVVQIYAESFVPDYDNPWRDPETESSSGSGFVIADDTGKKYIVTNAHVAENPIFLQARLANDRHRKYEAKVKCVSYQCDLALLEVEDSEFNELAVPVELGNMVDLHEKVTVVGFPMGGTEISVSKGIVSRIQVDTYSMSNQSLLQVQVDAAINPGNSGGPAFSNGKVIGVAFQGITGRQGLGYIIPIPIVHHFLAEALSNKKYRGFPTIPITTEELENPNERSFYQLATRTGVLVKSVDNLSDAYNKLKRDDILLSIDGLPISNEGTVDLPGIGKCIDFNYITQSKFIGEKVNLKVLRNNKEIAVEILLDTISGDTEKVPVAEHDKMPTFYINSGISFMPLSRNYMEGEGSIFEEMLLVEENCALPDAPKKNANDQIVLINQVLKCKETQGYDKHINAIVKKINGMDINNIHDVLVAMEGNKDKSHVIVLACKSKIVIPNMSTEDFDRVLKRNHISHARSEDLVPEKGSSVRSDMEQEKPKPKKRKIVVESSSDEEENTPLTSAMLPGLKRFSENLNAMEAHYSQFSGAYENEKMMTDIGLVEEDNGDELYIDTDDSDENSSQAEEGEDDEDLPLKSNHKSQNQQKAAASFRFFKSPASADVAVIEKKSPQFHK